MTVRFDDSLPLLVRVITSECGPATLNSGIVLRDATGRLAFFASTPLDETAVEKLSTTLRLALGPYGRTDRIVAGSNDFGTSDILKDASVQTVLVDDQVVRILDRRFVGADWLRAPAPTAPPPPRFVFASLKGGVGRSTALAVASAYLASYGRRVLAIDFDLEAPGLGAMLLDAKTLPEFGLIDALVENGLSPLDDAFMADLIGPSPLAERHGKVDVIPAFGRRSLSNPGDVLAKLARAYVEDILEDGTVATVLDQVRTLVDYFADTNDYDAILIDARAGLHETAAAAILGLGAEVFLFGLDEPQTFQGFSVLLAHLSRFVSRTGPTPEWLDRLTFVQGKTVSIESHADFRDRCRALLRPVWLGRQGQPTAQPVPLPAEPFKDVPWNDDVDDDELGLDEDSEGQEPLAVFDDERFRLFQPVTRRDLLSEQVYWSSYGPLLKRINEAFPANLEGSK